MNINSIINTNSHAENKYWNKEYQYYCKRRNLFYTAITKNASSEIIKTLLQDKLSYDKYNQLNDCDSIHVNGYYVNINSWRLAKNAKYKLLVIRNPIDRFVSAFNDVVVNRFESMQITNIICDRHNIRISDFDFNLFVDFITARPEWFVDPHFKKQADFIVDIRYNIVINLINLNKTWRSFFKEDLQCIKNNHYGRKKIFLSNGGNVKILDLLKIRNSGHSLDVRSYINKKNEEKINSYYWEDFELYNCLKNE